MTGGGTTEIAVGAALTIGGTYSTLVGLENRTLVNKGAIVDKGTVVYGSVVDLNGAAVLNNQGGTLAFKTAFGWADCSLLCAACRC